jgi:hypothetical protein
MSDESTITEEQLMASVAPKRHLSASAMLLALLLFPLPWINLSCGEHTPGKARKVYFTATQSGFQATYGGASYQQGTMTERQARAKAGRRQEKGGAPLLVIYAILLAVGIVASFKMKAGVHRLKTQATSSAAALAVLLAQMALGFPLEPENVQREPDPLYHLFLDVNYTVWFYLAFVATTTAPIFIWIEWRRDTSQQFDEDDALQDRA